MDSQSKSNDSKLSDDSGYLTETLEDFDEDGLMLQMENMKLGAIERDEIFLEAIFNDAAQKACKESLTLGLSNANFSDSAHCLDRLDGQSTKQELQRKSTRSISEQYDKKTTAAVDSLFQLLIFHDNCDLFYRKAEETWFWKKSVPEANFLTAKCWFKELVFYFKSFQFYIPVILELMDGKTEVKLQIPSSTNMEIHFPWNLFPTGDIFESSDSEGRYQEEHSVIMSAEKLKEANESIYISKGRLRKLETSVKKLLSKFEALLILSSPVGHEYNKASFMGRRKSNEASVKDPFDDPVTLI